MTSPHHKTRQYVCNIKSQINCKLLYQPKQGTAHDVVSPFNYVRIRTKTKQNTWYLYIPGTVCRYIALLYFYHETFFKKMISHRKCIWAKEKKRCNLSPSYPRFMYRQQQKFKSSKFRLGLKTRQGCYVKIGMLCYVLQVKC